ncbi:hypothetical protein [Zoogloea sp.]|uniref:hypothetical protein n=1 Tax=Zoogloea sp. TaxID=49181 RepID=UPI0035B19954
MEHQTDGDWRQKDLLGLHVAKHRNKQKTTRSSSPAKPPKPAIRRLSSKFHTKNNVLTNHNTIL